MVDSATTGAPNNGILVDLRPSALLELHQHLMPSTTHWDLRPFSLPAPVRVNLSHSQSNLYPSKDAPKQWQQSSQFHGLPFDPLMPYNDPLLDYGGQVAGLDYNDPLLDHGGQLVELGLLDDLFLTVDSSATTIQSSCPSVQFYQWYLQQFFYVSTHDMVPLYTAQVHHQLATMGSRPGSSKEDTFNQPSSYNSISHLLSLWLTPVKSSPVLDVAPMSYDAPSVPVPTAASTSYFARMATTAFGLALQAALESSCNGIVERPSHDPPNPGDVIHLDGYHILTNPSDDSPPLWITVGIASISTIVDSFHSTYRALGHHFCLDRLLAPLLLQPYPRLD